MYIEKLQTNSVKQLQPEELICLADEIRRAILFRCSKYGGHVGSNLGIVELTVALHYVFELPKDKIIFDVSHQSYPHKILTGRGQAFVDESRFSEVVGFSNPKENVNDLFHMGHTSTSISLAVGLAKARDVLGQEEKVIAVIGDAALGGGQAFEGLNTAAGLNSQFLIVLNDNEMSVFDNHGTLYNHLSYLRNNKGECDDNLFKIFGYEYRYLESGNDLQSLIQILNEVKNNDRPTVLHVHTKKGSGYSYAEADKARWHFSKPFDLETGVIKNSQHTPRDNYGNITYDLLSRRMKVDRSILVVTASTPSSFGFHPKRVEGTDIEEQFIDVGIEEQNALLIAAGMARQGGKVVFGTWATFFQRAYDQIAHEICLNRLPVTMLVTNASLLGDPNDTHAGIFDIAMFSSMPGLLCLAPAFKEDYVSMLNWSLDNQKCPLVIRIPWHGVFSKEDSEERDWEEPAYSVREKGSEIAILALGGMYQIGARVCETVREKIHFQCTLIDPRYANRVDEKLLTELEKSHKLVITMEDASLRGGFGAMIAQFYSEKNVKVRNYGVSKPLPTEFNSSEFMADNHMTEDAVSSDIIKYLRQNN